MIYYDKIAASYDELYEQEQLKKLEIIKKKCSFGSNFSLLDVGCGTGIATTFFPCKATGIDPSKALLAIGKEKHPNAEYVLGEAEHLPFKDNQFDVVISLTAIQNFHDVERGLAEIKRVGKHWFVLSYLKKSKYRKQIFSAIKHFFRIIERIEEEKDIIVVAVKNQNSPS